MFLNIFLFELKKNLKSPAFYIFTLLLFAGSLIFTLITDPNSSFMGLSHGKEWHNAPIQIAQLLARFSIMGLLFTMIIIGRSVAKDFEVNIHELIFASPVSKFQYLGGRFFGAFTANMLIFSGAVLGFEFGLFFLEPEMYGPYQFGMYLIPIFITVIPNVLLIGSIFFALASLSRNMVATYLAGVAFLGIYAIIGVMLHRMDNETLKVLLDPFGITGLTLQSKFWTVSDMNQRLMPVNLLYVVNRLIWSGFGFAILYYTFRKFRFVAILEKKKNKLPKIDLQEKETSVDIPRPVVSFHSGNAFALRHCIMISWKDLKRIIRHPAFLILTFIAISEIIMNFTGQLGNSSGRVYPFTSWYIEQSLHLWIYILPMTIFFGGMLIWKEWDYHTNEIMDTLPIPNWIGYLSKLLTLAGIYMLYLVLAIISGVITQVFFLDFYDIELGLYFKRFFGIDFFNYLHLAVVILFIQNLSPNKYIGFFFSAIYVVIDLIIFDVLRFDNILFRIGHSPGYIYSNMNGFGHYGTVILWYTVYWLFFGAIIAWLTILLWRRTNENSIRLRLKYFISHITKDQRNGLIILLTLFVVTGLYIGYNKYIINPYISENTYEQWQVDYEKEFSSYLGKPQPTITDIYLETDLYPQDRKVDIRGTYALLNHTEKVINEICLNLNDWNLSEIRELELNIKNKNTIHAPEFGFRVYELEKALQPGDSAVLSFDYSIHAQGFSDNHPMNEIVENGSCLMLSSFSSKHFPLIGYNINVELISDRDRKKYGLPPKPDAPNAKDANRYDAILQISRPNYEAVISTVEEQTAVTNGHLVDEWIENGRKYFHYKTDTIIENEIVILSAEYAVKAENYNGVNVEVYYHPKHDYNIWRIMDGLKDSYDYGNKYFSEYPYRDLRVVEVPDYMQEGAARHFPTTFIWKESEGFITRYNDDDIDIVYGIAAHENAHHWWAGIVTPAYAEGAFLLTESICQYVMAMLTEKKYGREIGRKYRKREMDSYLVRRKKDIEGESSLIESSVQQAYIGYKKSTSVMYALQDYIGEDSVGSALGRIVDKFGFRLTDYPLATDLIDEFRNVTPDSLQYLITDLFENITLYENKVDTAFYTELPDGNYAVRLDLDAHKFYADSVGNQTEAELMDYIYVGILGEDDEEIYYHKHLFEQSKMSFEIIVDTKPVRAGIDPFGILIDRNRGDNCKKLSDASLLNEKNLEKVMDVVENI